MAGFKIDESFKDFSAIRNWPPSCQLAMLIRPSGLQYSILDLSSNRVISLEDLSLKQTGPDQDFPGMLESYLSKESWVSRAYRSVIIGIENSWSTFLPDGLFDASRTASYLHFSFQLPAGLDYRHDRLTGADAVNAWAVPESWDRLIGVFFPAGRIVHHMTVLADHLRLTEAAGEQAVFLNLRQNSFDILMFLKGRLRFVNSFSFREKEDFVYYVLFVMEQAGIMADHYPVILTGDTHLAHESIELLGQYLSGPLLMDDDKRLRISPALAGMSWHRYFTVNHLHLCE